MLVHRLRRWPDIEPAVALCLVFAGDAGRLQGMVTPWSAVVSPVRLGAWALTAVVWDMDLCV